MINIIILIIVAGVAIIYGILERVSRPKYELLEQQALGKKQEAEEIKNRLQWQVSQQMTEIAQRINQLSEKEKNLKNNIDHLSKQKQNIQSNIDVLFKQKKTIQSEIVLLENDPRFELAEAGFYNPRYNFETSLGFENKLTDVRSKQETLLREKAACICDTNWSLNGSKKDGTKITEKIIQLMLRAFNGESGSIIAKVKFGNAVSFEKKISKSFEAINKLGSGFSCRITNDYLQLKIDELHLVYEYNEKLFQEKEEQKALREKMKEEERAAREIEEAQKEAEEEEERYSRALEQAREELKSANINKQKELQDNILELEAKLQEAIVKGQKAVSMAQLTKRGHVYIISNIGSFGENIFKIGMTRRLNPQDRIDELGSSSVPFRFDVHAMISCDDAPKLENILHKMLDHARVNKVNRHKEFFKVSFEEIEKIVKQHNGEVVLTKLAEAHEYRKSLQP